MAAKIASRDQVMADRGSKAQIPKDIGGRARYYGVLPKYFAMGRWQPCKKRRPKNGV